MLEEKSKSQTEPDASQITEDLFNRDIQERDHDDPATATDVGTPVIFRTERTRATWPEPGTILAGKKNSDTSLNIRIDSVARGKPNKDGTPGPVDFTKTKAKGKDMINKDTGKPVLIEKEKRRRLDARERNERNVQMMLHLTKLDDNVSAISANLLAKSGLSGNRVMRDLNILESSVNEAARHLRDDDLQPALDQHFMLDNLDEKAKKAIKEGKGRRRMCDRRVADDECGNAAPAHRQRPLAHRY